MNKDPFTAKPPADRYLARAAWVGSMAAVLTWLNRNIINIDAPAGGRSPLLWAISRGHKDVMNLLIQKGADIFQKTEEGDTALACAVWSGDVRMVQLMLDRGFDPLEKNRTGKTPLDWAAADGNAAIADLLKQRAAESSHACAAVKQRDLNALAQQRKIVFKP